MSGLGRGRAGAWAGAGAGSGAKVMCRPRGGASGSGPESGVAPGVRLLLGSFEVLGLRRQGPFGGGRPRPVSVIVFSSLRSAGGVSEQPPLAATRLV
jgi:hypothetical protein